MSFQLLSSEPAPAPAPEPKAKLESTSLASLTPLAPLASLESCVITHGSLRRLTVAERSDALCIRNGYKWVVTSLYHYENKNCKITVPIGFLTDGATGGPDAGIAWLFHDYLYANHRFDDGSECTRADADNIMVALLWVDNMRRYSRVVRWLTRANFCWQFSRAWERSGRRGVNFISQLSPG